MMTWASLIVGLLTVVGLLCMVLDDARARITQPGKPSPLSGMSFGDVLMIGLYVVPILLGIGSVIHLVLTE